MAKNRTLTKKEKGGDKNMNGLILACMYSCNCEKALIYNISGELQKFISEQKQPEQIKRKLKSLESYKFYQTIAKLNTIDDPFDWQVVSYYWKGAPELRKRKEIWHNRTTLLPLIKIPMEYIETKLINKCFIHPAKVVKVGKKELIVEYRPIIKKENKLTLSPKPIKEKVKNKFKKNIAVGSYLTIHFSSAIETISYQEYQNLIKISCRSLQKFNSERNKKAKKK